ncbi:hypothetical protein HanIR_Chr10g0493131 [Helianthus annuus]|nr:hypothetical protein HanIR_Chr10g0493131 [Helianthus annuus]KAJ0531186.1 hypothetical protein HanHA89_Chr10g0398371 [Helianthus annuus]
MRYKVQTTGTIHVLLEKTKRKFTLWKKLGTKCVDHPCTFKNLGTKSKILVNHRDHSCTLLFKIFKPR